MSNNNEDFNPEEVPKVPPKNAVRSTVLVEQDFSVQPPPKSSRHTEADINAKLGIAVRRQPPPPPPADESIPGPPLPTEKLSKTLQPVVEDKSLTGSAVDGYLGDNARNRNVAGKSQQTFETSNVERGFSQLINESRKPQTESTKASIAGKANGAPIPAPRSINKRSDTVSIVEDSGDSTGRNKASNILRNANEVQSEQNKSTVDSAQPIAYVSDQGKSTTGAAASYDTVIIRPQDRPSMIAGSTSMLLSSEVNSDGPPTPQPRRPPGKLKVDGLLAQRITIALGQRPQSSALMAEAPDTYQQSTASDQTVISSSRAPVDQTYRTKNIAPASPEASGAISDDCISDGGEFYDEDYDVEFSRPSEDVLLKSVPIVPSQQHKVTEKKGYLYKYTSQKGTLSKLASPWQQRWVTLDSEALRYFSTNKSYVSKRMIPVCTMNNLEQDIRTGDAHPFRFRLKTVDRVYRFAADTADDLAWWTSLLMRSILGAKGIAFKVGGEMHSPNMEGFVRMEGFRGKRYLAIKNGKFCFYNTVNDFKGFSPIHQVQLQLGSIKDMGKGKLVLQTPQVAFTFLFDTQEELMSWKMAFEAGISYALGDNKVLDEVYENHSNRHCADCGASGPEWAAINLGITLCQNCAGVHRNMANAKVRSLRMDSKVWTPSLIQLMKEIGNSNANAFWQWSIQSSEDVIESDADMPARVQFINLKYKEKRFCCLHQLRGQQTALNELLCKVVQRNDILETMQLVFSGADVACSYGVPGSEGATPYQLAEEARQTLQMEFLLHNGGDHAHHPKLPDSLSSKSDLNSVGEVTRSGYLLKSGPNVKAGLTKRWFVLKNGVLSYFENEKGSAAKDAIDRREMISVTVTNDEKVPFPFELSTSYQQNRVFVLSAETNEERMDWIMKLATCLAPVPLGVSQQINDLIRGGMVYLKFTMAQEWSRTWIHISRRTTFIYSKAANNWTEIDMRKAVSIKRVSATDRCSDSSDAGQPIFIDLANNRFVYIQGENTKETDGWFSVMLEAMTKSTNVLSDQPLTPEDVPVIVDKLIEFVAAHGLQTEGIYRLGAQNSVVARLLDQLAAGPRAVCLRIEEYQVHDAATALKRFLRNLDDPVLTRDLYDRWIALPEVSNMEARLLGYKQLIGELPAVNYSTLRRLILHLIQVIECAAKNLMSITNLATVFGPVLLTRETDSQAITGFGGQDVAIVHDLLDNYRELFFGSEKSRDREQQLDIARQKLARLMSTEQTSVNEIMFHVYINSRDGQSVGVQVSPTMSASEMLTVVIEKAGLDSSCSWLLQEVICSDEMGQFTGKLERPIHGSELVAEVMRRWTQWPKELCQSSYIAARPSSIYDEIFHNQPFDSSVPIGGELKYSSKKTFKKYMFELNQSVLTCRKEKVEKSDATKSWDVSDMVIFIGIPLRRTVTSPRCGFTFLLTKDHPTRESFGHSVSCSTDKELYRWLAALLKSQHPHGWSSKSSAC